MMLSSLPVRAESVPPITLTGDPGAGRGFYRPPKPRGRSRLFHRSFSTRSEGSSFRG